MQYLKKISFLPLFSIILFSCKTRVSSVPEIKFKKDTFSFGEIKRGDSVNAVFVFSNSGKTELVIKKVGVSCGCTNAYTTMNKLKPDEQAAVHATYHSEKDSGHILKTIIVETNCNPVLHVLYVSGKVNP